MKKSNPGIYHCEIFQHGQMYSHSTLQKFVKKKLSPDLGPSKDPNPGLNQGKSEIKQVSGGKSTKTP